MYIKKPPPLHCTALHWCANSVSPYLTVLTYCFLSLGLMETSACTSHTASNLVDTMSGGESDTVTDSSPSLCTNDRVQGTWDRVQGTGYRVQGTGTDLR